MRNVGSKEVNVKSEGRKEQLLTKKWDSNTFDEGSTDIIMVESEKRAKTTDALFQNQEVDSFKVAGFGKDQSREQK